MFLAWCWGLVCGWRVLVWSGWCLVLVGWYGRVLVWSGWCLVLVGWYGRVLVLGG